MTGDIMNQIKYIRIINWKRKVSSYVKKCNTQKKTHKMKQKVAVIIN